MSKGQPVDEQLRQELDKILENNGKRYIKREHTITVLATLIQAECNRARIDGILEGFKMSSEGWNGEYPYGDKGATDEKILADILPPELQQLMKEEEK